jgi:tripartite-type tricarboxylate transporter receptor subunit TctC
MRRLANLWSLLLLALASSTATAQAYPNRPVKIIVPFAAGSGSDVYARLIAEDMGAALNQNFIVENRAGASAQIGTLAGARAPADGYTLLIATNTGHSANPSLFKKLPYDPLTDFTPIGRILYMPYLLLVPKASPIQSVAGLIEAAKTSPSVLNYGYGNSTSQVISAEFSRQAKIVSTGVAYKSMPPALTDLLGGQLDYLFIDVTTAQTQLKSGSVKVIGFSLAKRSAQLPEVPAIAETAGLAGFEITSWVGLVGPAGLPADVVQRLNAQLQRTLAKPEIREKLIALGAEVVPSSAAEMDQFMRQQLQSWSSKIRNAGILPE